MRSEERKAWSWFLLRWAIVLALSIAAGVYMIRMSGSSYSGPFKPLSAAEVEIRENLKRHVWALAREIGERNLWRYPQLEASADYIEATLAGQGYRVARQEYKVEGLTVNNLETEVRGTSQPERIVIIGAHYDSVYGCPGANDNGTGTAAMLEIARLLKQHKPGRTLRFVAFVNEEPPFFMTGEMGSVMYARRSKQRGEQVAAMLSLETIGYYSDAAGSQHYPAPLSLFYPDTANFIGFVGNISSRELVRRAIKTFRATTEFPSEGGALPGWIPGVGWSDHWSFWQEGYDAIMITDTALFRYQHYHTPDDTLDKIDFDRMALVVASLVHVVADLTGAQ